MADKKINEFNEGELVKILGLDSNGNSLKEELASIISAHLQSSVFKLSKDLIDSIHEEGIVAYTS